MVRNQNTGEEFNLMIVQNEEIVWIIICNILLCLGQSIQ